MRGVVFGAVFSAIGLLAMLAGAWMWQHGVGSYGVVVVLLLGGLIAIPIGVVVAMASALAARARKR
jgi:hypothetical protein